MRILIWHVHGSWTTAFVQGPHTYVVPVTPDRGPDGLGRARTWDWPASVVELPPEDLRTAELDLVVLQRPHEFELARAWLGRTPGRDVPAVYLEHNAPHGNVPDTRHPAADLPGVPVVHVTHFNRLMWDTGSAPATVVEHGIVDPGPLYTGELPHAAVVVNEPLRRGRTTGTDLLPALAAAAPLDVFGMGTAASPATWAWTPRAAGTTNSRRTRCTRRSPGAASTSTPSAGPPSACPCWRRCTWACPWSPSPPPRSSRPCPRTPGWCPTGSTYSPTPYGSSSPTPSRRAAPARAPGRRHSPGTDCPASSTTGSGCSRR